MSTYQPKNIPRRAKPIQKSLSKYLKRPKNDHIPRYFHYDGHQALFLSQAPPEPYTEISQVRWKYTKKYLILTSTPELLKSHQFTELPTFPEHQLLSRDFADQWTPQEEIEIIAILKSHLQKAVRLGKPDLAISTINYLSTLAPIDLLRRIPIIMIEDVHLQQSFTLLCWVMVYYSTIKIDSRVLSLHWLKFLEQVITDLCQSNYHDDFSKMPPEPPSLKDLTQPIPQQHNSQQHNSQQLNSQHPDTRLTESQRSLLLALQLRKSYGGLHCDQRMLDSLTMQWYQRFTQTSKYPNLDHTELSSVSIINTPKNQPTPQKTHPHPKPLDANHFIDTAIDFHPCPWLLNEITKKHPNLNADEVKTAIWQCRSSINLRHDKSPTPESINIWSQIQDQVAEFIKNKKTWLFERLHEMEEIPLTSSDET